MTSEATSSAQIDAPVPMAHNFRPQEYFCRKDIVSPKSAVIINQFVQTDSEYTTFPEPHCVPLTGKPPGGRKQKKLIQRSASSDAILSNYLTGEWLSPNLQPVIKPRQPTANSSLRNLPPTPKSASPGLMTKSHLNLWPGTSLFKKKFRSSFKKLCQGSMEGLNQELETLTLTSEDVQKLQSVPDGHRAPVQELLDMFCDSPPTTTTSHLPLLPTLSSSSSSPPPSISSASSKPRHHHHHHHHQSSSSSDWSPRGSPEVPTTFNLGSEVRQVKPIRCAVIGEGLEMRDARSRESPKRQEHLPPPTSSRSSSSLPSSSSSLLSCTLPRAPLLSPVAVRANIPSNQSAFASYPTLPKSFKVKDTLRVMEGFGATAAAAGQS